MSSPTLWLARHRLALALPMVVALTFIAQPVAAGNPQADVNAANQALKNAQSHAGSADQELATAQSQLAAVTAQLAALQQKIQQLDATVAVDSASYARLRVQLDSDRQHLAQFVRQSYENGGQEAELVYIISASDIAGAIQRKVQLDHVATAAQDLVNRIVGEATLAASTLAHDNAARAQLAVAENQANTTEALVAVQEEQVREADANAHAQVQQAAAQLTAAQKTLAAQQAAQAAALARARQSNVIFTPVSGAAFTVDTDLTKPSGETADRINQFLQGTALEGLGASFMRAEATYHVSARYFVAHAILESDWGASAIAQDKHNLFGFNADDRNPYSDASTFSSFDACIQYVAQFVASNYLSPSGPFFHGPTLRGMNVDYASDPNWADKIASIARTIP